MPITAVCRFSKKTVGRYLAARHNLRAAEIGAQLFKFAVELSQGSKARYVLRIPPENFIGHIQYQLGISPAER